MAFQWIYRIYRSFQDYFAIYRILYCCVFEKTIQVYVYYSNVKCYFVYSSLSNVPLLIFSNVLLHKSNPSKKKKKHRSVMH